MNDIRQTETATKTSLTKTTTTAPFLSLGMVFYTATKSRIDF